jgi:hypothetical protein
MNPNSGEVHNQPQPQFELPPSQAPEREQEQAMEKAPAAAEGSVGKQAKAPVLPAVPATAPPPIVADNTTTAAPTKGSAKASNLPAADVDRIEKEWVDKAKAIVAKTQDDPFEQKEEMSKVKAQYIQKRFNKNIPSDDTVKV